MKLKVIANLAISLDGKIADIHKPSKSFGTSYDKRMMKRIRSKADVLVMGAETLRVLGRGVLAKGYRGRTLANVIVSASGSLDPHLTFWDNPSLVRFLAVPEDSYVRAVNSCRDRAFVVRIGDASQLSALRLLEVLELAGYRRILVEGGGKLLALFLEENLIDEIYLTLTPWILGGTANPSLATSVDTLSPWRAFKLRSARRKGDEVYLHYQRKKK